MKKIILLLCLFCLNPVASAQEFPEITSGFGWRIHPIYNEYKFHTGVDFAMPAGTPVYALLPGIVTACGDFNDGYGVQVLIHHYDDTYTRYAHLSELYVGVSQQVAAQTIIGLSGATGNVTGAHLHLEYIIPSGNGEYIYQDPLSLWK